MRDLSTSDRCGVANCLSCDPTVHPLVRQGVLRATLQIEAGKRLAVSVLVTERHAPVGAARVKPGETVRAVVDRLRTPATTDIVVIGETGPNAGPFAVVAPPDPTRALMVAWHWSRGAVRVWASAILRGPNLVTPPAYRENLFLPDVDGVT